MEWVLYKIHYVGKPETWKQRKIWTANVAYATVEKTCCMQVQSTTLSQATQNKRTFRICHMECVFCKIKYMGKSEKQKKKKKIWMANVAHATAGKWYVACMSRALHLSQVAKTKKTFKNLLNATHKSKFFIFLTEYVYVKCSMLGNAKHHLVYALVVTDLTYLIQSRYLYFNILPKTQIQQTCRIFIDLKYKKHQ